MKILKLSIAAILLALASTANAIPLLQIYIEGATYDSQSETWVTNANSFNVWVIANTNGPGSKGNLYNVTLVATAIGGDLSGMSISGTSTSVVDDPSIASNPTPGISGIGAHHSLASHGIFTNDNIWQDFLLGDMVLSDSPIGDATQGEFPEFIDGIPNSAQINVYNVNNTSALTSLHFDGFGYYGSNSKNKFAFNQKYTFAPFSHDAESLAIDEPIGLMLILTGFISVIFNRSKVLAKDKTSV